MLFQLPHMPTRRGVATLTAVLAAGAGGGALAATALDHGTTTIVSAASPAASTATATATASASQSTGALSVSDIYERAKRGVVDITVTAQSTQLDPFGDPVTSNSRAEGSGFAVDRNGDIVTNQHVVDGARSITVKLADGTSVPARVVGQDAAHDLAVIRVESGASKLTPLALGDSSTARVGHGVVAMGSPYGLAGSVTSGVVSALDRTISSPNGHDITGAIQTDAPINPGNSGGPLLDSSGRVIGVNSQIESSSGGNTGVGFAISSNTVRQVVAQIVGGQST